MKNISFLAAMTLLLFSCKWQMNKKPELVDGQRIYLADSVLMDKIKGGWAGQTIGVTYGGPTEFKFTGTMIQNYVPVPWYPGVVKWWYENAPGLYDDIYMDLTFVEVFDRLGLDAPVDSFAMAFASAGYSLWHANQAARVNVLKGIMPPESGHWRNNPHADCIDYQIEADFAGIMSPGMVNAASQISDKIGHIMNYGDGWYGGVYVGAMYALAFVSNDIEFIVKEALKTIPEESEFYQCISEVIDNFYKYPDDWRQTWFEVEKNWTEDNGCPDGVLVPFNIDAKVNAAYIIIGLLYGGGDFGKTIDISTRCGQDSDCNPSSSGGILGTVTGYTNIPEFWERELYSVEDMDFRYTTISLNDTYKMSFAQAVENILRNGGKEEENEIEIIYQEPKPVRYEKSFQNLYPVEKQSWRPGAMTLSPSFILSFEGTGFVIGGSVHSNKGEYVAKCEVYIDNKTVDTIHLSSDFASRSPEFYWNYELENKDHTLELVWMNPEEGKSVNVTNFVRYSDKPFTPSFE